ncbi:MULTISPECIES: HEAT repeat domain-containing protein [unclassified Corallococcus]|uniref:HEAT repeat domain-containing protein n=1 Tax=unclassified Corallococcus TaxID=2685029 RepID=UPI001A8D0730|nr:MULTISPECIES: HEAT repeat domain-containing protein [unclassified Corallococcus]MBN9682529.1 HEAT repeat domain-containing protein [Corallococcus sp. NCSPR001]WAS85919.1 HEAT repeat domain-containing protein [Corallococcus sp. NCRR]
MRRSTLVRGVAGLGALVCLGALPFWLSEPFPSAATVQPAESAHRLPLFRWRVGEAHTFHLVWDDLTRVALPMPSQDAKAQELEGVLHLDGELTLQALETRATGTRLRLTLRRLARHEAVLSGQALLPDAAALQAHLPDTASAWLELDARGALQAVRFSEAEPPLFRQFAQTLSAELFPSELRDAASWTTTESTQTGEVESTFAFEPGDTSRLTRRRSRYQSLRAAGAATVAKQELGSLTTFDRDAQGHLVAISQDEVLDALGTDGRVLVSKRLRLRLTYQSREVQPLPSSDEQKLVIRTPSQIAFELDPETAALQGQADGMTVDALLETLEDASGPDAIAEMDVFARRAIAALTLEPKRCQELARLFLKPGTKPAMRELMLDLLVGAGHAQAQATLRTLLQSPEAREHAGAYVMMVQRAGFLTKPEPETGVMINGLLERARTEHDVPVERATSYALGVWSSHLDPQSAEARAAVRTLETAVAQASGDEARAHALRAMGGTRAERLMDVVPPHLRAESPDVRAAAADALRAAPQELATRLLLDALETEKDRGVQRALLDALNTRSLDAGALEHLRAWVVAGGLAPGEEPALLAVAAQHLEGGTPVFQMLQAIAVRPDLQAPTRARVMALMAQVGAQLGG